MPKHEREWQKYYDLTCAKLFEELDRYEREFKWAMNAVPGGSGFVRQAIQLIRDAGDRLTRMEINHENRLDYLTKEIESLKAKIEIMEKPKNG